MNIFQVCERNRDSVWLEGNSVQRKGSNEAERNNDSAWLRKRENGGIEMKEDENTAREDSFC